MNLAAKTAELQNLIATTPHHHRFTQQQGPLPEGYAHYGVIGGGDDAYWAQGKQLFCQRAVEHAQEHPGGQLLWFLHESQFADGQPALLLYIQTPVADAPAPKVNPN